MRYTRAIPAESAFLTQTAVIMGEVLKIVLCSALVVREHGSISGCFEDPAELLKTGVPALLYLLQNNLQYIGLSYLQPATYQVTYQLKILSTALLSVLLLAKAISKRQWMALALLTLGVILVILAERREGLNPIGAPSANLIVGLGATMLATLFSSLAGVYFEKILKGASSVDLWQRNLQLATYSVLIGLVGLISTGEAHLVAEKGFFHGYTHTTVVSIHVQALGGLLIAVVIKYTDNILKNIATSMATVLTSVLSS